MLGEGIIKGMGETARNFFGSYVKEERLTACRVGFGRFRPFVERTEGAKQLDHLGVLLVDFE